MARQLEAVSEQANSAAHMMQDGVGCIEILHTLQEMRAALCRAKMELLEDYLEHWQTALVQSQDPEDCRRLLKVLPILFESAGTTGTTYSGFD